MRLRLIRNATLALEYAGRRLLVRWAREGGKRGGVALFAGDVVTRGFPLRPELLLGSVRGDGGLRQRRARSREPHRLTLRPIEVSQTLERLRALGLADCRWQRDERGDELCISVYFTTPDPGDPLEKLWALEAFHG